MIKRLLLSLLSVLVVGGASYGFTLLIYYSADNPSSVGGWPGATILGTALGSVSVMMLGFVVVGLLDLLGGLVSAWWMWVRRG